MPHNKRFMLNCKRCSELFHANVIGSINVTKERKEMEEEYICPLCSKNQGSQTKPSDDTAIMRITPTTSTYDVSIQIIYLKAHMEPKKPQTDESCVDVLKYITPYFSAIAVIKVWPFSDTHMWKFGFIQGCSALDCFHTYLKKGYSSWEVPLLKSGKRKFICDTDTSDFPFCGTTFMIKGPLLRWQNAKRYK